MSFRDIRTLKRRYAGQAGQLVNEFYIPVLREAVAYDRQAGYFDSASLVQLAAGLAVFIEHVRRSRDIRRPAMRLITGATWTPDDVDAYKRGHEALSQSLSTTLTAHFAPSNELCLRLGLPLGWRPEADDIAQHRLGALAWLVASGLVEVRVALPLDYDGRPYAPGRQGALYHPKAGVLWDEDGNGLYFQGSVNETGAAWTRNREKFDVRCSWCSDDDAEDIRAETDEFNTIWKKEDPGLLVMDLPQAVKERLLSFVPPDGPPEWEPMDLGRPVDIRARIEAEWFIDAPRRPGGEHLVLGPLWADGKPLALFHHQTRVVERATAEFPQAFLFCDEVGLGKTIEAGLGLRELRLGGHLRRVLILAPRALVRQWMEELREKFALTAWFYDGDVLQDVGGRVRRTDHPWDEQDIVIASRQLVARRDRREEFLNRSVPWDLAIVDEAHAARRHVMGDREENLFLTLLRDLRNRRLCRSLWLLTATPMQIHPQEVHDLLLLCGLADARWAKWASFSGFEGFFEQLRVFHLEPRVRQEVLDMARIAMANGAPALDRLVVPSGWQPFDWGVFADKIIGNSPGLRLALNSLRSDRAQAMTPHLSRQTPLAVHMFRHTRATLRAYQERGLVYGLARREPRDVPVEFASATERALYHRIDELCEDFYRTADVLPEERSGIGFLMAVFRKRLASCFYAFRRSLERRRDLIDAIQREVDQTRFPGEPRRYEQVLMEEPEEEDDPEDVQRMAERERERLQRLYRDPRRRQQLERERLYLQRYIRDLEQVPADSKFEAFQDALRGLLDEGHRVLVFTQYVDTMDFIRDRLVSRFGDRIACYSGRGGEVWDASRNAWMLVTKAEIKSRARSNHPKHLRVLLGSDAASEGLNLQQFSSLINYDLPWNPMRVEQRIGRIDRIGQTVPALPILNLYVMGTIEEDAYDTLKNRIGVFEDVVGPLQPILAEMPVVLRRVARREIDLDEARRLLAESAAKPAAAVAELDRYVRETGVNQKPIALLPPPCTQRELAAWCLSHPAPAMLVTAVPEPGLTEAPLDGTRACLRLSWPTAPSHLGIAETESILATFDGALADRYPPTGPSHGEDGTETPGQEGVRLLTWGDPYLEAWLYAIRGTELTDQDYARVGLTRDTNPLSGKRLVQQLHEES
jgi:hypothetical protein